MRKISPEEFAAGVQSLELDGSCKPNFSTLNVSSNNGSNAADVAGTIDCDTKSVELAYRFEGHDELKTAEHSAEAPALTSENSVQAGAHSGREAPALLHGSFSVGAAFLVVHRFLGSYAGQGTDFHLGLLRRVFAPLVHHGSEPAKQEGERNGHDSRVAQREDGEVGTRDH